MLMLIAPECFSAKKVTTSASRHQTSDSLAYNLHSLVFILEIFPILLYKMDGYKVFFDSQRLSFCIKCSDTNI